MLKCCSKFRFFFLIYNHRKWFFSHLAPLSCNFRANSTTLLSQSNTKTQNCYWKFRTLSKQKFSICEEKNKLQSPAEQYVTFLYYITSAMNYLPLIVLPDNCISLSTDEDDEKFLTNIFNQEMK